MQDHRSVDHACDGRTRFNSIIVKLADGLAVGDITKELYQ
jgi:hypothetical protein